MWLIIFTRNVPAGGEEHRRQWLQNYAGIVDPGAKDFALSRIYPHRTDPVTRVVGIR